MQIVLYKIRLYAQLIHLLDQFYEYGAINIRSPELAGYTGKIVKVRIELSLSKE